MHKVAIDRSLIAKTFRNTTVAVFYVFLVSQIMQNGDELFSGNEPLAAISVLLLFSLSAAVMGGLVFGLPVLLFFEGKKSKSVQATIYGVGWLALYTAMAFCILLLVF